MIQEIYFTLKQVVTSANNTLCDIPVDSTEARRVTRIENNKNNAKMQEILKILLEVEACLTYFCQKCIVYSSNTISDEH